MPLSGPPWGVVHLVFSVAIGGQEMVILSLCERADRLRFAPRVLCFHGGGALQERFSAAGIAVDVLDAPLDAGPLAVLNSLRHYLHQHRTAILHTHNPTPHQYGALAAVWAGVPILVHTKHGRNQLRSAKGRLLERIAGRLTDMVVPVSDDAADVARTADGIPPGRIQVIRNGVDLGPAPPQGSKPSGWRVVHVARLNEVKDQPTLLRAARLLADSHPSFSLDIVGDGEERDALMALTAELKLGDRVRFHGPTGDVRPFLAGADLFALSSISEGISLTLLEAMAAALPVVATNVGGNPEVIVHGTTGLLVPPRDPVALADGIARVLGDPGRAAAMGRAGRERAEREFSIDRTVQAYEALYGRLLLARGADLEPA